MIKTTLVFPIYNALKYTKRGLSYIYDCFKVKSDQKIPIEIVITDDSSTDGSSKWIKENYPNIILLNGNGNLWWSGGINKAIKYCIEELNSEYFTLWNNDIRPQNNYFDELFKLLISNKPDTIICSKIYFEKQYNLIQSMGGMYNSKTGYIYLNGSNKIDGNQFNKPMKADWFPGMGTTLHRNVFEKIGFFDEDTFPQYHGDSDFGLRATKAGFKIFAYPQLKIWNDTSNTGFSNNESFSVFFKSLTTLKSNFNISKDIKFCNRHSTNILAYMYLIKKYLMHIGGFLKWKILGIFGMKRK
ncbi:MAG: glycosyltransferase family 2 protein [Bacteroidales bacterium]|nr:glycosyltransferase family 2 protein [Bacteroidales bacterium]